MGWGFFVAVLRAPTRRDASCSPTRTHHTHGAPRTQRTRSHIRIARTRLLAPAYAHTRARIYARPHSVPDTTSFARQPVHVARAHMTRCACIHARVYVLARAYARVRVHLYAWPSMDFQAKRVRFSKFCRGGQARFASETTAGSANCLVDACGCPKRAWLFRPVLEASGRCWAVTYRIQARPQATMGAHATYMHAHLNAWLSTHVCGSPYEYVSNHIYVLTSRLMRWHPCMYVGVNAPTWMPNQVCGQPRELMGTQIYAWMSKYKRGSPPVIRGYPR